LVALLGLYFIDNFQIQSKMDLDSRNKGVEVAEHYESLINYKLFVCDLKTVFKDESFADVFRVFLHFAEKMRGSDLDHVKLAYQVLVRYILTAEDFKLVSL